LSWEAHIKYVSTKLSRVIYLLRSLISCVPESYVRSAYFAFFQSTLSYGLLLWGNSAHVRDILLLQKKAIRTISYSDRLAHCRPLFVEYRIQTVINLYIYSVLLYTKKNLTVHQLRKDIHSYNTRSNRTIDTPFCRLSKTQNSYENVGLKLFNKLPQEWIEAPAGLFKQRVYSWLLKNPFYSLNEFLELQSIIL
jgi:hypothetical protein